MNIKAYNKIQSDLKVELNQLNNTYKFCCNTNFLSSYHAMLIQLTYIEILAIESLIFSNQKQFLDNF